jgi:hypothetical protein
MSKARNPLDTLRAEYKRSDFPAGLVRGKYAKCVSAGTNMVRLDPEIAEAFPTSKAVNDALAGLLRPGAAVRSRPKPAERSRGKTAR